MMPWKTNTTKIHPKIKFTVKLQKESRLNFLYISITKSNKKHDFSIFHKSPHTDTTINKMVIIA